MKTMSVGKTITQGEKNKIKSLKKYKSKEIIKIKGGYNSSYKWTRQSVTRQENPWDHQEMNNKMKTGSKTGKKNPGP